MSPVDIRKKYRARAFDLMLEGNRDEGLRILNQIRKEVNANNHFQFMPGEMDLHIRRQKVRELMTEHPEYTPTEIAGNLGFSRNTISNDIKILKRAGEL